MLTSRSYAKKQGHTYYYTGVPCPQGHIADRRVQNGNCVVCLQERQKDWMERKGKEWHRNNYFSNHEHNKKQSLEYSRRNSKKMAENNKAWRKDNPDKNAQKSAMYRARKMNATPQWTNEDDVFFLNEIYAASKLKTESTGIQHHVDHIVPLKGNTFCGLHVWWNLQVITATENLMKHNSLTGEL